MHFNLIKSTLSSDDSLAVLTWGLLFIFGLFAWKEKYLFFVIFFFFTVFTKGFVIRFESGKSKILFGRIHCNFYLC